MSDKSKIDDHIDKFLGEKHEKGIPILAVAPGSRAELVGLRKGDRIVAINDKPLLSIMDYVDVVNSTSRPHAYDIIRGNTFMTLKEVDA